MLLAYYGDDFTGSTDVLEALTTYGVATVLFTEPPSAEMLARFPNVRAVGVAGNSRTMSPDEMESALPLAFQSLARLGPKFVHYKVCSTFDSSPHIGSIGRAIDIGARIFQNRVVPLVVAAPGLQRFCAFGNLFARSGLDSPVYRLDRHPTMSRHPVTPMIDADLRMHLAKQTSRLTKLVDVLALSDQHAAATILSSAANGEIILFDTLTRGHLAAVGRIIAEAQEREQTPQFVAGSSGVEYALVEHWKTMRDVVSKNAGLSPPSAVDRALVISGSCSPVMARQAKWALENSYREVPLDAVSLLESKQPDADVAEAARRVETELDAGHSVIVHTHSGTSSTRNSTTQQASPRGLTHGSLGVILGRILGAVLRSRTIARVAVVGGDTAGSVAREIGIDALEMRAPLAPGAPLCVARSRLAEVDGVEFTFKGGQVGHDDFFGSLTSGRPSRNTIGGGK